MVVGCCIDVFFEKSLICWIISKTPHDLIEIPATELFSGQSVSSLLYVKRGTSLFKKIRVSKCYQRLVATEGSFQSAQWYNFALIASSKSNTDNLWSWIKRVWLPGLMGYWGLQCPIFGLTRDHECCIYLYFAKLLSKSSGSPNFECEFCKNDTVGQPLKNQTEIKKQK